MTVGSQEWQKYPFLIKSNRPGTKRGRSTAGRPTTILSLGISDHYKPKGRFFCDSKERCRYDLIEAFAGGSRRIGYVPHQFCTGGSEPDCHKSFGCPRSKSRGSPPGSSSISFIRPSRRASARGRNAPSESESE